MPKYIVVRKQYNEKDKNITWEKCSLRKYLNNDFINTAFSESERALIKTVAVKNEDNKEFGTKGGNDTSDKIFLLSIDEIQKYFTPTEPEESVNRICRYKDGKTDEWWLRSPGIGKSGKQSGSASYVDDDGSVYGNYYVGNSAGVRPALWINLK